MRRQRLWWLHLLRGLLVLMVGVLILGWPDVGGHLFGNFIAMFWLLSGIMSLQWGLTTHQKRGLWLLAGVVGTVVGSALLLRFSYQSSIDPAAAVRILGALALCIGLMKLLGGFKIATMTQEESLGRFLPGGIKHVMTRLGSVLLTTQRYTLGCCHLRERQRLFRLDRITYIEMTAYLARPRKI